jgi:hypothetical protein
MKLRFSIRDLFWLVLVVVLAIGWWIDHREKLVYYRFFQDSIEQQQRWQSEHPAMAQK